MDKLLNDYAYQKAKVSTLAALSGKDMTQSVLNQMLVDIVVAQHNTITVLTDRLVDLEKKAVRNSY